MPNFQAQTLLDKASSDDADLRSVHPASSFVCSPIEEEMTETSITKTKLISSPLPSPLSSLLRLQWSFFPRFMALTDLVTEASHSGFAVDETTETKIVEMVLKLMEDTNGEVKNAGVKA